jgi:hypothetical protein
MGFDQKGATVFCVSRGKHNKWDVSEKGFDKPLASFDTEQDASAYAHDIARTKAGAQVIIEDSVAGH